MRTDLAPLLRARPLWAGAGGVALVSAAGLVCWLVWALLKPAEAAPAATQRPLLLPLEAVVMTGGGRREVGVVVDRQGYQGPLSIQAEGLPERVTCAVLPLPGDPNRFELRLTAEADAEAPSTTVAVSLWAGRERAAEQPFTLTVQKFLRPRLRPLAPVTLKPGETRSVEALVDLCGCDRPLTLRMEGLPPGVGQRPVLTPLGTATARLDLAVAADARPRAAFAHVVLLAGDVEADKQEIRLTVEGGVALPRLVVKRPVVLSAGASRELEVEFERSGVEEAVDIELVGLPGGVKATRATVAAGDTSTRLEVRAADDAAAGTARVTLSGWVGRRKVAQQELTLTVVRPTAAARPDGPGPHEKPPTPQR
jgi:hypothetical protein